MTTDNTEPVSEDLEVDEDTAEDIKGGIMREKNKVQNNHKISPQFAK